MADRIIQERFQTPHVIGEWEACERIQTKYLSDREVLAWVRNANRQAKIDQEYVKFRSIPDESGDSW
jgi:hypothetical protein